MTLENNINKYMNVDEYVENYQQRKGVNALNSKACS